MSNFSVAVVIPAAGASRRYHEPDPGSLALPTRSKLDEDLGGRPVLQRTVELFNKLPDVSAVIVAGPADPEAFRAFSDRHADKLAILGVRLTQGGIHHRYETVANALKLVPDHCTHIAVHDAARPCTSAALIERIFDAARPGGDDSDSPDSTSLGFDAVIPGVDVPDTLKRVDPEWVMDQRPDPLAAILSDQPASGKKLGRLVTQTLSRDHTVAIQTPQLFRASLLKRAYAQSDLTSTDDAQLIERLAQSEGTKPRILVIPGESTNIKITRSQDLSLARAILGVKPPEERAAHKRF